MILDRNIVPSNKVHIVEMPVAHNCVLLLQKFFSIPVRGNELPIQKLRLLTDNPVEKVATQLHYNHWSVKVKMCLSVQLGGGLSNHHRMAYPPHSRQTYQT